MACCPTLLVTKSFCHSGQKRGVYVQIYWKQKAFIYTQYFRHPLRGKSSTQHLVESVILSVYKTSASKQLAACCIKLSKHSYLQNVAVFKIISRLFLAGRSDMMPVWCCVSVESKHSWERSKAGWLGLLYLSRSPCYTDLIALSCNTGSLCFVNNSTEPRIDTLPLLCILQPVLSKKTYKEVHIKVIRTYRTGWISSNSR